MKKATISILSIFLLAMSMCFAENSNSAVDSIKSQEQKTVKNKSEYKYNKDSSSVIQISIWTGVPNWPKVKYVNGLKLGLYATTTNNSPTNKVNGVELAGISQTVGLRGFQFTGVTLTANRVDGFQLALLNALGTHINGLQIAISNFNLDDFNGVQLGSTNISQENSDAVQLGLVNILGDNSNGAQIGVFNDSEDFGGFQLGVLNLTREKNSLGFQVGLINYMENGFLPVFPLFNFSIREVNEKPEEYFDGFRAKKNLTEKANSEEIQK